MIILLRVKKLFVTSRFQKYIVNNPLIKSDPASTQRQIIFITSHAGFGIRDSGLGDRGSDFGIQVSGYGFRDPGFGIRVSGFGIRDTGFGIRVSESGFQVSGTLHVTLYFSTAERSSRASTFAKMTLSLAMALRFSI